MGCHFPVPVCVIRTRPKEDRLSHKTKAPGRAARPGSGFLVHFPSGQAEEPETTYIRGYEIQVLE